MSLGLSGVDLFEPLGLYTNIWLGLINISTLYSSKRVNQRKHLWTSRMKLVQTPSFLSDGTMVSELCDFNQHGQSVTQ